MDEKKLIELEKKHIMQTYARKNVVFEKGKNAFLFDSNGKKYIDFVGAIATNSIGYGNAEVAKAIFQQSKKLVNATNLYYTEEQVLLAEKISKISKMQKCFFSNSGTEAVEAAIKLARKHTGKKEIIACENSFHGRTMGALSLTWKQKYKQFCAPLIPQVKHVPFNDVNALESAITNETAAFFVEPIQGEGGIIMPSMDYLLAAYEICQKKEVLFVADEVQTLLRTGKFFGFQHEKFVPDIVCTAKGIANGFPIGVTISAEEIDFEKGQHGSTFGGNSLACSAALATVKFIEKNNLVEKAKEKGNFMLKELEKIESETLCLKNSRGKGLMLAIDSKIEAKKIVEEGLKDGIVLNAVGDYTLRFLPPLTIEKKEIKAGLEKLEKVLQKV